MAFAANELSSLYLLAFTISYKLSLLNAHALIMFVHTYMNVNKLRLNRNVKRVVKEGGGGMVACCAVGCR